MKKITLFIILISFIGTYVIADESRSPLALAAVHAELDKEDFQDPSWGMMAFGATTLFSPVLGGVAIAAAYSIEPSVVIPRNRLNEAQEIFGDGKDFTSYKYVYRDAAKDYLKQDRIKRAWIGTGIGFGIELLLVGVVVGIGLWQEKRDTPFYL